MQPFSTWYSPESSHLAYLDKIVFLMTNVNVPLVLDTGLPVSEEDDLSSPFSKNRLGGEKPVPIFGGYTYTIALFIC